MKIYNTCIDNFNHLVDLKRTTANLKELSFRRLTVSVTVIYIYLKKILATETNFPNSNRVYISGTLQLLLSLWPKKCYFVFRFSNYVFCCRVVWTIHCFWSRGSWSPGFETELAPWASKFMDEIKFTIFKAIQWHDVLSWMMMKLIYIS